MKNLNTDLLSDLTIILVIRDRVDFTDRWLSYYKRNFSYVKVIIADGSNEMLFTKSQEQNLSKNLQYLYNGPDNDIPTMIGKIRKSLSLVKSKFVLLASDDDFYLLSGIINSIQFLKENVEWHASMGIVRDFTIIKPAEPSDYIYGKVQFGDELYKSSSISEPLPLDRIRHFCTINDSFWHAVYRTESLLRIYCAAEKTELNSIMTFELFLNVKSAEIGKLHRNRKSLFMLHQVHPQMEAYKLKNIDKEDVKLYEEINFILGKTFRSLNNYNDPPTFENIQKIRQELTSNTESSTLRSIIQRVKFKFALSKLIAIVNHLDPFTAKIYRNKEVRSIIEFLKGTK